MRSIGLHIRFDTHFESVIEKAQAFDIDIVQAFFINQQGRYVHLSQPLIEYYRLIRNSFKTLYAHSSYCINLADATIKEHPYLKKEIQRMHALGFSHLIVHPGARVGTATKEQALDTVVRRINTLLACEPDISLILENSGHARRALGGDIADLYYIRSRLDRAERVTYCIDTAHAHVYGYDIVTNTAAWIDQIELLLGDAVSLLHLNDTKEAVGSQNDRHCFLGEGILGAHILRQCANHSFFRSIPIILELPPISPDKEQEALHLVRTWVS